MYIFMGPEYLNSAFPPQLGLFLRNLSTIPPKMVHSDWLIISVNKAFDWTKTKFTLAILECSQAQYFVSLFNYQSKCQRKEMMKLLLLACLGLIANTKYGQICRWIKLTIKFFPLKMFHHTRKHSRPRPCATTIIKITTLQIATYTIPIQYMVVEVASHFCLGYPHYSIIQRASISYQSVATSCLFYDSSSTTADNLAGNCTARSTRGQPQYQYLCSFIPYSIFHCLRWLVENQIQATFIGASISLFFVVVVVL